MDVAVISIKWFNRLLNDVGLIEVDRQIEFTDYIKPVCLPDVPPLQLPYPGVESEYEECYVTGFGNYRVDGKYYAFYLNLPVILWYTTFC